MISCPSCGPVIVLEDGARDGDAVFCRVCGSTHRLHRKGDSFATEPMGDLATAEQLKPMAEVNAINDLVRQAPATLAL